MGESHHGYDEYYWFPVRDSTTKTLQKQSRRSSDVQARIAEVEARVDDVELGRIVRGLVAALQQPAAATRRVAAAMLQTAFVSLQTPVLQLLSFMPEELRPAVPALIAATADADVGVRRRVLSALEVAASRVPPAPIVRAVIQNTLNDPCPVLVAKSLKVLTAAGVDAASVAAPSLAALLKNATNGICLRVHRTLAWLGEDAGPAVPALLESAMRVGEPGLRREALLALQRIDPDGVLIDQTLGDSAIQTEFLALLRELGTEARPLRRALQSRWRITGRPETASAPPGLEGVWLEFTETERELLIRMWQNRRPNGFPVKDLYPLLCWESSADPDNCLRTHLSKIRTKLRKSNCSIPFKRKNSRVFWLASPR